MIHKSRDLVKKATYFTILKFALKQFLVPFM